jgi:cysteine desulfurase
MPTDSPSRRVYLDYNSTTPLHPEALEAMLPYLKESYGNPSSAHWLGRKARARVEEARESVAALLGAAPQEIIFCSGGTESDNLAIKGAAWNHPPDGGWGVVTSAIEHSAVLKTVYHLSRNGYRSHVAMADGLGMVDVEDVADGMDDKTALVSVMHSNNETGVIQPINEIAEIARSRGILCHTDAVQSAGKVRLDVRELGVDLLSISAHKLYGPKGVGALYVRRGVALHPLITGGGHERGARAGTENVSGIIGFGKACEIAAQKMDEDTKRITALRDDLQKLILERIPSAIINGHPEKRLPNTLNVCLLPGEAEALMIRCDLAGVAVSAGSACASGSIEPSHVLMAMGIPVKEALGSIRLSLGRETTREDLDYAAGILPKIVDEIRGAKI